MQLTREETREIAENVRGRWVRLLDPTAVGTDVVLEGFNRKFYGDDDAFVSYIGNSNGYAVAAVHFASGASATVTMDRIAEVYPDPDEDYDEPYDEHYARLNRRDAATWGMSPAQVEEHDAPDEPFDEMLAQQELEDFAQDGEFENMDASEIL